MAGTKAGSGKMSQTGKRSQKVGGLGGPWKDAGSYSEMGSLHFNRIEIPKAGVRRPMRMMCNNQGPAATEVERRGQNWLMRGMRGKGAKNDSSAFGCTDLSFTEKTVGGVVLGTSG